MSAKKICTNCQTEFDGKFCPECGTKWEESPTPEPVHEHPTPTPEQTPEQPAPALVSEPTPEQPTEHEPVSESAPSQKSASAKAAAVDDTPHTIDGKPVLWHAYKVVRWAHALTLFGAICIVGTVFVMFNGISSLFTKSFMYEILVVCAAAVVGVVTFFVPVKYWSPMSLLHYKDKRRKRLQGANESGRLSKPTSNSIQLYSSLVDTVAMAAIAFLIAFVGVVIFTSDMFTNYSLIALTCGTCMPIGISLILAARILKRREDELRMHFLGTKKPTPDIPWLRGYNEEKEIAFLNEYKQNSAAIAGHPSSMVDVLPQTAKGISALVLAALAVVYLCIHCAIFSPYRVYCLQAIPFDRRAYTSDITAYLGDSDTNVIDNQVIFVKSATERTTVTIKDDRVIKIEYDCNYDEEKKGPASHKVVAHREIVSGTKVFCGVPVKDKIVMECTYTDGSYRKMIIPLDGVHLEADMLLANKFIFAIHDDWELQSFMHFDSVNKLSGKVYGVNYHITGNGKYASLVLSGNGTVKDDDFRYRSAVDRLTIKKGITHGESSPYGDLYNLETVVIESGVKNMPANAFGGCKAIKTIWCEDESAPEDWDGNWLGESKVVVHWGNEWEYVNGTPTLKPTEE